MFGGLAAPQGSMSSPARPVHPHAYLTFGAGMRQKEIDMYSVENMLEGISGVTGNQQNGIVPYHIPTSVVPRSFLDASRLFHWLVPHIQSGLLS